MSELKSVYIDRTGDWVRSGNDTGKFYLKSEVDKVIAELKAESERLRGESCKLTDGCLRLKQCRKEKANIADELRDTSRALWLAREWRAWCEVKFWSIAEGDKPKDIFHLSCTKRVHRMPITWVAYWQEVARKCKVKAEEVAKYGV